MGWGLFLLAMLAFLPALRNGYIWDDDQHVTGNAALRSMQGLWRIWFVPGATPQYYPLAFTVFWVEYHLWGLWASGYHAVNLVIHGLDVVLLWRVLRRIGVAERVAILGAALWGIHPVQVETVDWVMELKNVLSTFFYLCSARLLLRMWDFESPGRRVATIISQREPLYAGATALFALALLTKSVTATLPAAFLLVLWWRRGRIAWRDVAWIAPLLALGAASGMWTAHMEHAYVGAQGEPWALTGPQRVLVAGRAATFYAAKLAWPWKLTFFYPHWLIDPARWRQWLYPAGVVVVIALLAALRKRIGRGPAAGVLYFLGTLFPALGFISVYPFRYSFVADHFQYLACAGLLVPAAWLIARLPGRVMPAVAALVVAALTVRSFARCLAYRDAFTLYSDVVAQDPHSWVGRSLLAGQLEKRNDPAGAQAEYAAATQLAPDVVENYEGIAHTNLTMGHPELAERQLEALLKRTDLTKVRKGGILNELGGVEEVLRHRSEAEQLYRESIAADPRLSYPSHYNLAAMLMQDGDLAGAEEHFRAAVDLVPENADGNFALAQCLWQEGKRAQALVYLERAASLNPDSNKMQQAFLQARAELGR